MLIETDVYRHRLEPAPPEKLLKAFRVLDQEGKGFVDREYMTKLITEEGEPFTAEELEEMMAVAVDMATDKIPYENYLNQLLVSCILFYVRSRTKRVSSQTKHEPQDSIYALADKFKNQIRRKTIFKFYRR